jgi:hypothetical protein
MINRTDSLRILLLFLTLAGTRNHAGAQPSSTNGSENPSHPGNSTIVRDEIYDIDLYTPKFEMLTVASGKLLFMEPGFDPHRLICIATDTGMKLWEITEATQGLRPGFLLNNQFIVMVGSDVDRCDLDSGRLTMLYRPGYDGRDIYLIKQPDDFIFVHGTRSNVDYLALVDAASWRVWWEAPRVHSVIGIGQDVVLCEQVTRMPVAGGGYGFVNQNWTAVAKSNGKVMWTRPPCAKCAAVSNYFLTYLSDTISCLDERDGSVVRKFTMSREPYPYLVDELATRDQELLIKSRQRLAATNDISIPMFKHVYFSLSVPDLHWKKLSESEWNDAFKKQFEIKDSTYEYTTSTDADWKNTTIVRTEIKTGNRTELYREPVPPRYRRKK